jgi:hypothetical protein
VARLAAGLYDTRDTGRVGLEEQSRATFMRNGCTHAHCSLLWHSILPLKDKLAGFEQQVW